MALVTECGSSLTVTLPHLPVVLVGTVWGLPILLPQYPRRTGTTDLHGNEAKQT